MLDPTLLRDNMTAVRTALENRGIDLGAELEALAALDSERRRIIPQIEGLKREQNAAGEEAAAPSARGAISPLFRRRAVSGHSASRK